MFENTKIHPVLVCGTHFNGLGVIRAFGEVGIPVYAIDTVRGFGSLSRYAKFWKCPDPSTSERKFIDFLIERSKQFEHRPLLFPTMDSWATAASKHKTALLRHFHVMTADWEIIRLVIKKDEFFRWAQQRKYPVPKTYLNLDEINKDAFPIVAKPAFRYISSNSKCNKYISEMSNRLRLTDLNTIEDFNEFCGQYGELLPHFIFQEKVMGMANRMYSVGIYADKNSELLAIFTGRKVRGLPPDIGDCLVGQSEPLPELVELTRKLVRDLRYTGVAEVEFKKDARTEEYKLIEINPRSWSWIGITPACGVNIPLIAYNDVILEQKCFSQSQCNAGEVKWIRLVDDLMACMRWNRKLGFPEEALKFGTWFNSLKGRRIIAEFDRSDPLPFAALILKRLYEFSLGRRK